MISGLPEAIAHVAGPSLAPLFKKAWTTWMFLHPMARSSGRMPFMSTCSISAPLSSKHCTVAGLPWKAARSKGIRPVLSVWLMLAPRSIRHCKVWSFPLKQAQHSDVRPSRSSFSRIAPVEEKCIVSLEKCLREQQARLGSDFTATSVKPLKCGAEGGLKCHKMFYLEDVSLSSYAVYDYGQYCSLSNSNSLCLKAAVLWNWRFTLYLLKNSILLVKKITHRKLDHCQK